MGVLHMSLEIIRARRVKKAPRFYDDYTAAGLPVWPGRPADSQQPEEAKYYLTAFKSAVHAPRPERKKRGRAKIIALALAVFCAAALILTALSGLLPIGGEADIYNQLVRLHILANSNSQRDQAVKYYIRNYVVSYIAERQDGLTDPSGTPEAQARQAIAGITRIAPRLQADINALLAEMGFAYSAQITIDKESYPTRVYGALYVPSGTYSSVRVLLGQAAGHNWWCVLFPPLCLAGAQVSASDARAELQAAGYTDQQIDLMIRGGSDGEYVVRFKFLEWFEEIKKKITGR